jgi:hypothetical protein
MTKKAKKASSKSLPGKSVANKKTAARTTPRDQALRDHVLYLLKDGGAHIGFDDALSHWPIQSAGTKVAKFPHTAWMLLEHMRLAQRDILDFSRNSRHVSPPWPEGYWPELEAPPNEKAWIASITAFKKDLRAMEQIVSDKEVDLFARIPWGDGQTILREALLVADHNAYHLGQLLTLRKSLGI